MKENWTYKKLGEVCSFINDGDWIESKDQSESGIRLIQTGNIGNGEFKDKGEHARYISYETFESLNCTEIFNGDCLVSRLPEPIGRCCILPQLENRCITAVDCSILRFKEDIIPRLFVYYSQSQQYAVDIANKTTGTTRKRISRKNLENIPIPLPPLSVQQSIVAELDEINNLLQLKKKELETFDKLAQSIFYEMFGDPVTNEKGWETSSLENVCSSIIRGPFGSALKKDFFVAPSKSTYKVYEQKHAIQKDAKIGSYYVTEEKFKELSRFELKPGDIIMSCSGTIGELFVIPVGAEKGLMNQALLKFTLNNRIINEYFMFLMECVKQDFTIHGAGLQNIGSVKIIKTMSFGLPPLSLQQVFATRIEAIEQQKEQVKASINKLETLLASRMQYWFD